MDENFFEVIDSEIKSYLLGFFVADGGINIRKQNRRNEYNISFSQHIRDLEVINFYKHFIKPTSQIRQKGNYIRLGIYSKKIVEDIIKLGYNERKTYSELSLPKIETKFLIHFIRGYFDGDGTCVANIVKEKTRSKNKDCYYRVKPTFHIGAKTKTLITEIQNYFKTYNVNLNIYYYNSNDFYFLKSSSKKEIKKIYDLFYCDSKYYLTRKKLSFEKTLLTPSEFKKITIFEPRNA